MLFREITIPFGGRDYVVTPSNKVLRRIEAKARLENPSFNLVEVFVRVSAGNGAVNDAAFVLAELLSASGDKVTEDEALAHMIGFDDPADYRAFLDLFCACVMPEPKAKKPEAPPETA
jgi:hypothetical protein